MTDFDSPWKEVLDAYLEAFLAFFFPSVFAGVDWSRGHEALDKELQQVMPDAEIGRRVVDKLVKIWLTSGAEEWLLIHIEIQSQPEADFSKRVFVYNYRLFDRYNQKVVSLAVLADENPTWRPDFFGDELWGFEIGIRFPVAKLLDYSEEELAGSSNPFGVFVRAHRQAQNTRKDPVQRKESKLRLLKGLYEQGWSREDIRRMFRFIDWVMDLPHDLSHSFWAEYRQFEQEKKMPFVTSVEQIGIEKGIVQGIEKGIDQGRREGLLEAIALDLESRFGDAGKEILPEIQQIADSDVLRAVLRGLKTVATVDDLRRIWQRP